MKINIDVNKLIDNSISIQEYLFCSFISNKEIELMTEYMSLFNFIISKGQLDNLIRDGFIVQLTPGDFTMNSLKVTDRFQAISEINEEKAIQELKDAYPKRTISGKRVGLQADPFKWQTKYLAIIKKDKDLHEKVLECIELEKKHRAKNGQDDYWALLTTYVNNKRWEVYMEDVGNLSVGSEDKFSTDI